MAENSKIEWCDHTFNPWIGCQKVSPGCDHCYAETLMDKRYHKVEWGPHGERKRTSEANWKLPLRWAKDARLNSEIPDGCGYTHVRPRVFCASLADVFDNKVPDSWRSDLFALIEDTPELDWLLLTKRPANIRKMIWPKWDCGLPGNIWMGITAEDNHHYRERYHELCDVSCAIRFISYEPALDWLRIDWVPSPRVYKPDWIICGGESGPGAREMNPAWARMVRDHCKQFEIPFFMKQMTGKKPIPDDLMVREFPRPRPAANLLEKEKQPTA